MLGEGGPSPIWDFLCAQNGADALHRKAKLRQREEKKSWLLVLRFRLQNQIGKVRQKIGQLVHIQRLTIQ